MGHRLQPVLRLGLVLGFALALAPASSAHHNTTHNQNPNPPPPMGSTTIIHFDAGSLIIPLDACYARPSFMSSTDLNQIITPLTDTTAKCNGDSEKDDGISSGRGSIGVERLARGWACCCGLKFSGR